MTVLPDPVWPVLVLAFVTLVDAVLCIKPVAFVAQCWDDVHWPRRYWRLMAPVKFAAVLGLVVGVWVPYLGAVTAAALVLYFVVAISMHIRARDFGRNLFLNATGMLLICAATLVFSFLL